MFLYLHNKFYKGGERTKDEMCVHAFTFYPRINDLYGCSTLIDNSALQNVMNTSL